MWLIGPAPFLLIHGPIFVLAATIGVWLFYVQHQFENTRWAHEAQWSLPEAALHGSSYYDLPMVLRWFSANIGVHHVHHLSSRIPVLSPARSAARLSRTRHDQPRDAVAEPALRELHAVGRGRAAADFLRRLAQEAAGNRRAGVSSIAENATAVMAGLVPAIHVFELPPDDATPASQSLSETIQRRCVDGRDKPGHDVWDIQATARLTSPPPPA